MLETLKAEPVLISENQADIAIDNQQAICEWARLAGLIMGDGFFGMIPYPNKKRGRSGFTAVKPIIAFTNQDSAILECVVELYEKHDIKHYIENRDGTKLSRNPITNILVFRFDSVKTILENIIPWLVGDKKSRAALILRYVNKERRGRRQYDPDDADILRQFLALSPKNKKGSPSRLAEVLRDYEQNNSLIQ